MTYAKKRRLAPPNPWDLSWGEYTALEKVTELGRMDMAAHALHRHSHTLDRQLGRAREKMGAANTILAVLQWDRAVRGGQVGAEA